MWIAWSVRLKIVAPRHRHQTTVVTADSSNMEPYQLQHPAWPLKAQQAARTICQTLNMANNNNNWKIDGPWSGCAGIRRSLTRVSSTVEFRRVHQALQRSVTSVPSLLMAAIHTLQIHHHQLISHFIDVKHSALHQRQQQHQQHHQYGCWTQRGGMTSPSMRHVFVPHHLVAATDADAALRPQNSWRSVQPRLRSELWVHVQLFSLLRLKLNDTVEITHIITISQSIQSSNNHWTQITNLYIQI